MITLLNNNSNQKFNIIYNIYNFFLPQNSTIHKSIKPQILSVFNNITLTIKPHFKKYLNIIINTLQQTSQTQIKKIKS